MKIAVWFWRVSIILLAISTPAHAYIDPGTGLLLMQGLFAIVGGILAFVKRPWHYVTDFFKPKPKSEEKDAGSKRIN